MNPFITKGCMTNHGGIVVEADDSFIVDGKGVHLEGMKHFCPKCKKIVTAISLGKSFVVVSSKTIIMANDVTSCGAQFIAQQQLAVRDVGNGSGGGSSSVISSLIQSNDLLFSDSFLLVDRVTDEVLANVAYKLYREDGSMEEGITDVNGCTKAISNKIKAEKIRIEIVNNDFDLEEFFLCHF